MQQLGLELEDDRDENRTAPWVGAALEEKSDLDDLTEILAEMLQQTGGKLSLRERELADAALGMPSRSQKQA